MPKSKAEEIAELQALIDMMPDDTDEAAVDEYEKENKQDPEEVVEIQYRRVKRKHFSSVKTELTCEECGVTFYEHLPAKYEGRICGENCATTVIEKARDELAKLLSVEAIQEISIALLERDPEHLKAASTDPRRVPRASTPAKAEPASEPPREPQTIAEKIAARLK